MISNECTTSALLRLAYRGRSMRGVFRTGDCLRVAEVPFSSLNKGDIVAFHAGGSVIAHRITGRQAAGFITQGDACRLPDRNRLTPENVIGLVVERERCGDRTPVMNGIKGRLQGMILRAANRGIRLLFPALSATYRLACASRLAAFVWRPQIVPVLFSDVTGKNCTKFIHRGKTVACWFPHKRLWTCRKPYDLILARPNH